MGKRVTPLAVERNGVTPLVAETRNILNILKSILMNTLILVVDTSIPRDHDHT